MLLRETRRIQRRYGLSTRGSYVVQLVAESHGMDPEFVVLTEDTPTTGKLLTEALGLLLLFGAAMAAMYFGGSAIKSIFGDKSTGLAQLIPDKKEQEKYSSLLEKSMKDSGDKEDALKKLDEQLKKDGKSEEERKSILQKFMDWFKGQEEENSDEFKKVAEAWAILKDDKASEEDKKKAKEFIEKIAGEGNSETTKIESKENLIEYLEKVSELSEDEELQNLNQGGEEGTYEDFLDKNKEILETLQSLEEADEESADTLQDDLEEYLQLYDELQDEFKAFFKENGVNKLELGEGLKDAEWLSTPTAEEGPKKFTSVEEMSKYKRDMVGNEEIEEKLKNGTDNDDPNLSLYMKKQEKLFDYIDEFLEADDDAAELDLPDNTADEETSSKMPESYSWGKGANLLNLLFEGNEEGSAEEPDGETSADDSQQRASTFTTYLADHNAAFNAMNDQNRKVWASVGFGEFTTDEKAFEKIIAWENPKDSSSSKDVELNYTEADLEKLHNAYDKESDDDIGIFTSLMNKASAAVSGSVEIGADALNSSMPAIKGIVKAAASEFGDKFGSVPGMVFCGVFLSELAAAGGTAFFTGGASMPAIIAGLGTMAGVATKAAQVFDSEWSLTDTDLDKFTSLIAQKSAAQNAPSRKELIEWINKSNVNSFSDTIKKFYESLNLGSNAGKFFAAFLEKAKAVNGGETEWAKYCNAYNAHFTLAKIDEMDVARAMSFIIAKRLGDNNTKDLMTKAASDIGYIIPSNKVTDSYNRTSDNMIFERWNKLAGLGSISESPSRKQHWVIVCDWTQSPDPSHHRYGEAVYAEYFGTRSEAQRKADEYSREWGVQMYIEESDEDVLEETL